MIEQSRPDSPLTLELSGKYIELYKVLKIEGLCHSGGAAKLAVAERLVRVNGKVETRKRKKIQAGDVIEFENTSITVT